MVAITNGLFIDVLPNVSNFTRSLDWSSRSKYSTISFHDASLRSSPGKNPSTSSGAGIAARLDVLCDVVKGAVETKKTKSNSDAIVRCIWFIREGFKHGFKASSSPLDALAERGAARVK